jgi:hypothetical protein
VTLAGLSLLPQDLGDTSTLADPDVIKELIANHPA